MPYFFVFLFELIMLSLLTSHFSAYFLKFFHSITRSEKLSAIIFAIIFFPGTFIHELSHWLAAKMLFVHTSGMEFLPQIHEDGVKLGSVSIVKTDPIRRLLIGVAPVVVGLGILLGGLGVLGNYGANLQTSPWWVWLILGYLVLVIGSTMFSSRKDLEGSLGVILVLVLLGLLSYFAGFDWLLIAILNLFSVTLDPFFKQLSLLILIPLGLNFIIWFLIWSASKRL